MDIDGITKGKWKVISLSGRFDAQTSKKVEEALTNQLVINNNFIALDLSNIKYMSSAGLRVLLSMRKALKEKNGNLVLINPQENVMEVLELSGFSKIFFILNSIEGLT
ncbi:MAG: STAS domain-containing protein [Cyanobacteriota bacterium]